MTSAALRAEIRDFLGFQPPEQPVDYTIQKTQRQDGYVRQLIAYTAPDGDAIPAGDVPFPAALLQHQHNSERHLGKSEVCGLAGEPLQAFGPALAQRGFVILAPDSICFEDRRRGTSGIEPHPADTMQHFNEMCHRLVRGDSLMRKVLADAAQGLALLRHHPRVRPDRIGTLGHSYGENTVLFHAALDERIQFACSSGAVCSYEYKLKNALGLALLREALTYAEQVQHEHGITIITEQIRGLEGKPETE